VIKPYGKSWPYENNGHCLICSKACPEKTSTDSNGWDWFGGYLRVVVHFCPQHKTGELRDKLLAIGGKKPETWSSDEHAFVRDFKRELEGIETAARLRKRGRPLKEPK
jgi:hypothetical protein